MTWPIQVYPKWMQQLQDKEDKKKKQTNQCRQQTNLFFVGQL
jgi:hypothetical protein